MQVQKTNAARLLDAAGLSYTLVPYEVDEEHLEASHVAEQLGEDLDRVFKTLAFFRDRRLKRVSIFLPTRLPRPPSYCRRCRL